MASELPLIVLVGPTASGKTALAVTLAQRFGGEIICADSRTVYRGMDVGTAKPTLDEQSTVPHWGLDLVDPGDRFTAADFKEYATQKIQEIKGRDHIPFLVGGTGLYVDGLIFDYQFGDNVQDEQRKVYADMSVQQLQKYCEKNNIALPENFKNARHLVRAIELNGSNHKRRLMPIDAAIIVGISTDRDVLRSRICNRTEHIFDNGVVEEAKKLGEMYGWKSEAMTGNIYPLVRQYLDNEKTLSEIKEKFNTLDWRLAKRQMTWLKRNKYIRWHTLEGAEHYLSDILARPVSS